MGKHPLLWTSEGHPSLFPETPWLAVKESLSAQPEACGSCSQAEARAHSDRSVARYFEIALDENALKREKLEGRRRIISGVTMHSCAGCTLHKFVQLRG